MEIYTNDFCMHCSTNPDHKVGAVHVFAMIWDYFSDVQAIFNTRKLPAGIRVASGLGIFKM